MDRLSGNIIGLEFVPRSGPPDSHAVLTILHSTSGVQAMLHTVRHDSHAVHTMAAFSASKPMGARGAGEHTAYHAQAVALELDKPSISITDWSLRCASHDTLPSWLTLTAA